MLATHYFLRSIRSRIVLSALIFVFVLFMSLQASAITITEFSAGITAGSAPSGITAGPDGNLWFTEAGGNRIGRITPAGDVTEFSAGITPGSGPARITEGPDGNLWFTESLGNRIARISDFIHTVTASAGANGSIAPLGAVTVNEGATQAFTVTPNANYHAVMSGTCGGNLVGTTYTTNAVTADCTVMASFALDQYTVTASATNGSATPGTQTINYGSTATVTGTANSGYYFTGVSGCGGTAQTNSNQATTTFSYTTGAITADCTVTATYATVSQTSNLPNSITLTAPSLTGCTDVTTTVSSSPNGYTLISNYDITCTSSTGPITVTIPYPQSSVPSGKEGTLRMFHWESGAWHDVTVSVDTGNNTITGSVTSLSPFGIGYSTAGSGSGSSSRGTGANENMIAFAILAIFAGIFLLKRDRRVRNV